MFESHIFRFQIRKEEKNVFKMKLTISFCNDKSFKRLTYKF